MQLHHQETELNRPQRRRPFFSDLFLLCLGLVMLFGSQGWFFIGGNRARLGLLILGFLCIVFVALKRHRFIPANHFMFFLGTFAIFGLLFGISVFQGHQLFLQRVIFQLVVLVLFISGALLGALPRLRGDKLSFFQVGVLSLIAIPGIIGVLRFAESLAFYAEASRGYGETELNPIGLAYATIVLALTFIIVALESRGLLARSLAIITTLIVLAAPLTSGSRGPILFLVMTLGLVLFLLLLKKQLSWGRFLGLVVLMPLIGVGAYLLMRGEFLFLERVDLLVNRFTAMFSYLTGETASSGDMSIEARFTMQQYWLSIWQEWIILGFRGYDGYYPHNQFIEWGVRFGVLGLAVGAFFSFLLLRSIHLLFRRFDKVPFEVLLFFSFLMFAFLQSMTSLSLDVNRALFLGYGYFFGFLYLRRRNLDGGRVGSLASFKQE